MANERRTPVGLAVFLSIGVLALLLIGTLAIGGSYAISLMVAHRQQVAQEQLIAREEISQLTRSLPTCRAINAMDQASNLPSNGFPIPPHNAYDKRLALAIHGVNETSHCPLILRDVANHVPYTKILAQIRGG